MTAPAPIRVLMLSHYFEQRRGGIEIVAAALARELGARGFEVLWLAAGSAPSAATAPSRGSLAASAVAERVLRIPYPVLLPSAWRRIFRAAASCDVFLVHDALYMTSIIASLAARLRGKPYVVVQHVGVVPFRSRLLRGLMRLANRCAAVPILRHADRVIFISQLTMRYFEQVRWRRPPALIFNGVDTEVFSPVLAREEVDHTRARLGIPAGSVVALFVGRFVEKKGLQVLEALARLRPDVQFVFAGYGALDPQAWALTNVRVHSGLVGPALAPLYRASDVLLLPSVGEGFPLVVQEALACGLRIVCGADTATADPRAARFLDPLPVDLDKPQHTARRWSQELSRLTAQPATLAERAARADFARTYSWATSGAAYAEILRGLCPAAGAASELRLP